MLRAGAHPIAPQRGPSIDEMQRFRERAALTLVRDLTPEQIKAGLRFLQKGSTRNSRRWVKQLFKVRLQRADLTYNVHMIWAGDSVQAVASAARREHEKGHILTGRYEVTQWL